MATLSQRLDDLDTVLPPGAPVAYLDYPVHFNVGDLLIHLGMEQHLARKGHDVVARLSIFDLCRAHPQRASSETLKPWVKDYIQALPENTIVALHGGGNFGDLYLHHQAVREALVAICPERRIVILPQSIHFSDKGREAEALGCLAGHRDLHLFVRDQRSLEVARAVVARSQLMPDSAHALWGVLQRPGIAPNGATLDVTRVDEESIDSGAPLRGVAMDWRNLVGPTDALALRVIRKSMTLDLDPSRRALNRAWNRQRDRIVARAVERFSMHAAIATDRLHGVILAALLGRPVLYRDNSYGKVSRYVEAWLADSPQIRRDDVARPVS
jgi:pyruvyl transferase EpsO